MKSYHQSVEQVSEGVAKFFDAVFSSIEIDGPQLDAEQIQKSPLMVVSTHRSHIDYFFAGKMLYFRGFKNLRFAAGDNLTRFPYIGPRFKKFGAFTVSRNNGFERNYVRNLCNEVVSMMENGDALLVFPEGGRSYSGKMLEIRGGILNAAIILQARNPDQDVYLLPMSISYERAPDISWFSLLLKAKKLKKKSNSAFKRWLGTIFYFGADIFAFLPVFFHRLSKKNYGSIYCDYMAPVSVRELVEIEKNRNRETEDEFYSHRKSLNELSGGVYEKFISLYRLLPIHVVSQVLLKQGASLSATRFEQEALGVREYAVSRGLNVKSLSSLEGNEIVKKGIEQLTLLKAVRRSGSGLKIKRPDLLEYYASALNLS